MFSLVSLVLNYRSSHFAHTAPHLTPSIRGEQAWCSSVTSSTWTVHRPPFSEISLGSQAEHLCAMLHWTAHRPPFSEASLGTQWGYYVDFHLCILDCPSPSVLGDQPWVAVACATRYILSAQFLYFIPFTKIKLFICVI